VNVDDLNEFYVKNSFSNKVEPFDTLPKQCAEHPEGSGLFFIEEVTSKEVKSAWKRIKKNKKSPQESLGVR